VRLHCVEQRLHDLMRHLLELESAAPTNTKPWWRELCYLLGFVGLQRGAQRVISVTEW